MKSQFGSFFKKKQKNTLQLSHDNNCTLGVSASWEMEIYVHIKTYKEIFISVLLIVDQTRNKMLFIGWIIKQIMAQPYQGTSLSDNTKYWYQYKYW
jgi:hypothetical protein